MEMDTIFFPGMDGEALVVAPSSDNQFAVPRLRRPERAQVLMEPVCLEDRLPADHPARTVWKVVERLDLSAFYAAITARGSEPGRAATDPKLLVGLWLYAAVDGVGNGRELDRLCREHDAYRWLCGGVSLNYHTLNDFRVGHAAALDDLFTKVLAMLMHRDVVQVKRISQDGTRVRASAGRSSFRRKGRIEEFLATAKDHVEALKQQADEASEVSARQRAAQERAARERQARLEAALAEFPEIEAIKAKQREDKPSKHREPRVSMTDSDARKMKMGNGGFDPAYNVQIAADTESRAIVAIDVTNHGCDSGEDASLRAQVKRRTGRLPDEHLLDGGYLSLKGIEQASADGVAIYVPLSPTAGQGQVCTQNKSDPPGVAAWRQRMDSEEGKAIYKLRASTSETVNADLKSFRGLHAFTVRGLSKVRCAALWSALAYNVMHFAGVLMT
jgi:transposase